MQTALRQRGDTIIEVLLAMAVIGIVLGTAFGLANQAVRTGRDAHERGEALKLAESQLELLKSYSKTPTSSNVPTNTFTEFCIDMDAPTVGNEAIESSSNPAECTNIDASGIPGGLYTVKIIPSSPAYRITVTWDQINSQSSDTGNVTLYYRTGTL